LEHERLVELERKLSAMLVAQTERDRRIAQLTDKLAQNSVILERAEENATEAKKRAGLEQREIQVELDELLLSRDHVLQKASRVIEANENLQRSVPNSRRGSLNWQQSIYDSRTLRMVGPRARRQRQTHCTLRLRQVSSIRM